MTPRRPGGSRAPRVSAAIVALMLVVLAGCGRSASPIRSPFDDRGARPTVDPSVPNFPPPFLPPTQTPSAGASPGSGAAGDIEAAKAAAIDALAQRMGLPATRFTVERAEAAMWPDACLGVAIPGQSCAEVVTPGYRIVLRSTSGSQHEVHTGRGGALAWAPQATVHATVQQPGATLTLDASGTRIVALTGGGTQFVEVTPAALKTGDRVVLGADDLRDGSPLRVAWLARE